jgi:hypothetical protein
VVLRQLWPFWPVTIRTASFGGAGGLAGWGGAGALGAWAYARPAAMQMIDATTVSLRFTGCLQITR